MNSVAITDYLGSPSQFPKAVGLLRDMQLAALKVLLEVDRVCRECHLTYFAIDGTLLGAVRHGGFIPWDDDIDIAMPRKDYDRIVELFNTHTRIKDLQASRYSASNGIWNLIKITHKDIPSAYLDIFPVDFRYEPLTLPQKREFSQQLQQYLLDHIKEPQEWPSVDDFHRSLEELRDQHVPNLSPVRGVKPTVFLGLDFLHNYAHYSAFDYEVIFPLSKIKFENQYISCVRDPDLLLTYIYGDYMRVPNEIHMHTDLSKVSVEEMLRLKYFLRSNAPKAVKRK